MDDVVKLERRGERRQAGDTSLLIRVIQALSRAREMQAVADIVRSAARALAGSDGATFVLREQDQCHYYDEDAIGPLWKGRRFPMDACISGWCMRHGEVAVIEDIYADPRIPVDAYRSTFVKSLLMVPVRSLDPIGAIGNYWARPHRPSPDEVRVLSALADTTAVAMANVQIYAELERRVHHRTVQLATANERLMAELMAREQAADERARLLDKARNDSRARAEVLRIVCHDLRNPLANVRVATVLAGRQLQAGAYTKVERSLEAVEAAARHMTRLIDDLADIESIDAGQLTIERRRCAPGAIIDAVLDGHRAGAVQQGLMLARDRHSDGLPDVDCDRDRIYQALGNLLGNAIKITPPGGRITVHAHDDGDAVRIEVADTGPGIVPEDLPHLFRSYWRGEGVRYAGTGLGLAIANGIVKAHGGRLWADNQPGGGAVFCFTLPKTGRSND